MTAAEDDQAEDDVPERRGQHERDEDRPEEGQHDGSTQRPDR